MENISNLTFHRDPKLFRVNELAPRSYFIPFENE